MPMSPYLSEIRSLIGTRMLMIPAAVALIRDDGGRLMVGRLAGPTELWGLPGGGIEPGETPEQAVAREVLEETGLDVAVGELHRAYAGPDFEVTYTSGDQGAYVMLAYWCTIRSGTAAPNMEELTELRFVSREELDGLVLPRWNEVVLGDAFEARA